MKKYGKYEKRPEAAPVKQPKVKNMLLQTYFTSLLCLVLCVTMFMGTSYAWFTSEVNNTGNEIYIGTLDVELEKLSKADSSWLSLSELTGENNTNKLFDSNIRWEPGYTALETIRVVNEGDLAFKYVLNFTDGKIVNDENRNVADAAEFFDVWVYDHRANEGKANANRTPAAYTDISEATGWESVGTLAELLEGKAVLDGVMVSVRGEVDESVNTVGPNDSLATEFDTYTIALHMNESATTDVMGWKIGLNVKLIAYQMSEENDGLNTDTYDQMVSSAEELATALSNGGTVALATDIVVDEKTTLTVPENVTATLDLNGHKISMETAVPTSLITNKGILIVNDTTGDGEITCTFNGTTDHSTAVSTVANRGTMTVNGGTINSVTSTSDQIGYAVDNYNGATLTVNGGEIAASGGFSYDGIRLFCGSDETLVIVNDGEVSTIWAQNPSANKATEVKGTVIINGGEITKTYYENYTIVKVAEGVTAAVEAYGNGKDNTTTAVVDGYTVYSFVLSDNG